MSNLFIIGNGFDIAHKLPTRYEDFHNYLNNTYPNAAAKYVCVPIKNIGHHGDEYYDTSEVVGFLINLLSRTEGEYWSDVESSLGKLDFEEDFYNLPEEVDKNGDINDWHLAENNEDLARALSGCVPMISELFKKWTSTIDVTLAKKNPKFAGLIDADYDFFLNFNYTETLEIIYNIHNVCHIHGKKGEKILFGHGQGRRFDEENLSSYIGSEDGLNEIQDALRKDTTWALKVHENFFNNLSSGLEAIYSYGFAFSDVDLIYLQEIFRNVDTKTTAWYLHHFDYNKHEKFKETIRKCGFEGMFKEYDT